MCIRDSQLGQAKQPPPARRTRLRRIPWRRQRVQHGRAAILAPQTQGQQPVSYTHLRAHETRRHL
eukprot:9973858-Prorocentrum_lima.AAC.1